MNKVTIDWKTATDAEKNACFAERVAGFRWYDAGKSGYAFLRDPSWNQWNWFETTEPSHRINTSMVPDYLRSFDAVLPWLPKEQYVDFWTADGGFEGVRVCIRDTQGNIKAEGFGATFQEAAMIALLRAKGVEVIT